MTEQEKKLIELIEAMDYEVHESGQVNFDSHTIAKEIIKAFPQIYSERVFKARVKFSDLKDCEQFLSGYIGKKIEVYIKEVVS